MSDPKRYLVVVHGCDDSTYVEVGLTDDEAAVVERIADLVTETSSYGCMPTMSLSALKGGE